MPGERDVIMKVWRRIVTAVPAAACGAGLVVVAPASAATVHLVRTSASPMATTNNKVYALAYAHGVVYAGGMFTRMHFRRISYTRDRLGAVRSATGAPTSFRPRINGTVKALALSPDRKVLYVGGDFTAIGSHHRINVAAFSTSTGKLTSFAPRVSGGSVDAIAASSTGVYLGGTITAVDGQPRTFAAKVTLRGKVTTWAPELDGWVRALLISPDKTRIFLGGGFHHVNGVAFEALGSVNLTNGANRPFQDGLIPTYKPGEFSQVTSFSTNGTLIFAGAEGTGPGVFDGTLAFRPDTGNEVWRNTCLGATQSVLYLRGVLYKASHAHDCSSAGGFGQIPPFWQPHRLLAEDPATGQLRAWGTSTRTVRFPVPNTNGGLYNHLGPFALTTDGRQLFVGGEFTRVNGKPQEGLARFSS